MKDIQVLAFDVFGTVVDWYGSVCREIASLGIGVDANDFTLAWRDGYAPAMKRVMSGELGWTLIDDLHRMILDDLLDKFQVSGLSEEQIAHVNKVWHRLDPWPDSVAGLTALKNKFTICTLSNGNLGLLSNMAKRTGLPWDCILCAEVFRKYKPHPDTYLGVAGVFDVRPDQVMLVAAHQSDLEAAHQCGLYTAFIERPDEFGPHRGNDISENPQNTLHCTDFIDLARKFDCRSS
jgi:2-haloacid dehalogenase